MTGKGRTLWGEAPSSALRDSPDTSFRGQTSASLSSESQFQWEVRAPFQQHDQLRLHLQPGCELWRPHGTIHRKVTKTRPWAENPGEGITAQLGAGSKFRPKGQVPSDKKGRTERELSPHRSPCFPFFWLLLQTISYWRGERLAYLSHFKRSNSETSRICPPAVSPPSVFPGSPESDRWHLTDLAPPGSPARADP